jgi:hypothetical protein
MAEKPTQREPARKNGKRVTLHPRSFEEAVKEAWQAEPPKRKERVEKKPA